MAKIDPEINKKRVMESMKKHGTERINLYLPQGTQDRIKSLGFRPSTFAKSLVLEELDRLEKMKN